MPDARDLYKAMGRAALMAVEEAGPLELCFGTVVGVAPLVVELEQRARVGEKDLMLGSAVSDFTMDMTVGNETKQYTARLGLRNGEKVLLLRRQRKYFVLDRVR